MKNMKWTIVGLVFLVVLLAGGAYTIARLMHGQSTYQVSPAAARYIGLDGKEITFVLTPAAEKPEREADVSGVTLGFQNDNLIVGTGDVSLLADPEAMQEGKLVLHAVYSGPEVAIIISPYTQIYVDATDLSFLEDSPSGHYAVQEELSEVDTIDQVPQYAFIAVWGERKGNRIIADLVVYQVNEL